MNSNSFIWPSQPCILIPDTEKVYKPRPYRFYCQKTRNYFWLVNYTRSKILFLCSGNKLQTFKFERTLCIDTSATNFVYQKMELQSNIAYLWKKNYDVGAHLDFRQENDIRITTLLLLFSVFIFLLGLNIIKKGLY